MSTSRLQQLATNTEGFCFDPRTGETYQLNETAQVLLQALRAGQTDSATAQTLADMYAIPYSEAYADTKEFLQMLRIYGVLE